MRRGGLIGGLERALRLLRWLGLAALLVVALSGVKVIGPDEVGLVVRFGRLVGETRTEQVRGPGLLLAAPFLIDRVVRVPVKRIQVLAVGELRLKTRSDWVDVQKDGYVLAGDRGVVQLEAEVRYRIEDPVAHALHVHRPRAIIHDAVVAALTHAAAGLRVDDLLGKDKAVLSAAARRRAEKALRAAALGVRLVAVQLTQVSPPHQAAEQFQAVNAAYIAQKTQLEQARSYAQQQQLMADARRVKQINEATAWAEWLTQKARGEVAAFKKLASERRASAPSVVDARLLREALDHVFQRVGAKLLLPPGARPRVRIPVAAGRINPATPPRAAPTPWQRPRVRGER